MSRESNLEHERKLNALLLDGWEYVSSCPLTSRDGSRQQCKNMSEYFPVNEYKVYRDTDGDGFGNHWGLLFRRR